MNPEKNVFVVRGYIHKSLWLQKSFDSSFFLAICLTSLLIKASPASVWRIYLLVLHCADSTTNLSVTKPNIKQRAVRRLKEHTGEKLICYGVPFLRQIEQLLFSKVTSTCGETISWHRFPTARSIDCCLFLLRVIYTESTCIEQDVFHICMGFHDGLILQVNFTQLLAPRTTLSTH